MASSETRVREDVHQSVVDVGIDTGTRQHKAAATTAGILYIIGTVAGILSKAVTYFPVHNADDPLAYAANHSGAIATGALLVLVMGLSLAFVPVVLFPVLRRVDEVLATGYLILRGAVETAIYVILAIAWLLLVPLADTMSAQPGTASCSRCTEQSTATPQSRTCCNCDWACRRWCWRSG